MTRTLNMIIWLATLVAYCSTAVGAPPSAGMQSDRGTVAVLDFEAAQQPAERKGWAVGLADFMVAILADRGVSTLERRDLTFILSERRLQGRAILSPRETALTELPWVRFLLVGDITPRDVGRFVLSVSLIDTKNGHEVLRERVEGVYSKDVARGLVELGDKIAVYLGRSSGAVPKRATPPPGFTAIPEVALIFYRGLDWLMSGRPEFAEQYFRLAVKMDPTFLIASLWRSKAFRQLGLADFAQAVHKELSKDALGHALVIAVDSEVSTDVNQLVASVIAPLDRKTRNLELENALAHALIVDPHVQLFEPRRIHEVSNELDLALTGEFGGRFLPRGVTLVADILVSIGWGDTDPAGGSTIHMALLDATTGTLKASGTRPRSQGATLDVDCQKLFQQLLDGCDGKLPSQQTIPLLRPLDYGPAYSASGLGSDGRSLAYYLREYAGDQSNRRKLVALVVVQDWFYEQVREDAATFRRILANRLLHLIDNKEPEAANWLSQALWWIVRSQRYLKANGMCASTPANYVEVTLQPLVQVHPTSWAAFHAQLAIAVERAAAGKHAEATELLGKLVERIPTFKGRRWPESCKANLYFFAAREAHVVGNDELGA